MHELELRFWGGPPDEPALEGMRCSFCGRSHSEAGKLIAGPSVFICDRCIETCVHAASPAAAAGPEAALADAVRAVRATGREDAEAICEALERRVLAPPDFVPPPEDPICRFCGKARAEVRWLMPGPNAIICDECISLCRDIIAEDRR